MVSTGHITPAVISGPIGLPVILTRNQGYNSLPNVLDYVAVVIPVTFADKKIDVIDEHFHPLTELDAQSMATCECLALFGGMHYAMSASNDDQFR